MRTLLAIAIFITALTGYDLSTNFFLHFLGGPSASSSVLASVLGLTGFIPFLGIIPAALGAAPLCPFSVASGLLIAQGALLLFYQLVKTRDNSTSTSFLFKKVDCLSDCSLVDYMRNVFCGVSLRRNRRSYIWANIILLIPCLVIWGVSLLTLSTYSGDIDAGIIEFLLIPTAALYVVGNVILAIQRIHDLGKSAWLLVLAWIAISCAHIASPILENIANVVIWGCLIFLPSRVEGLRYPPA